MIAIIEYTAANKVFIKQLNVEWLQKYFYIEPNDGVQLSNPQAEIIDQGGKIFYATCNNQMVGTVTLIKINNTIYEHSKMAVTETMQGKGIGIALMEHCLKYVRQHKIQ